MADDGEDLRARTHRALASVSRVRILQLLRDGPMDVAEVTAAVGLHPNTVRSHLGVLERAELVSRQPSLPSGPGRPRQLYGLAPSRTAAPDSYRTLSEVLITSLLAVSDDPASTAVDAGRPLGGSLVGDQPPATVHEAIDRVVGLLDELGFAPERRTGVGGTEIRLRRCPFDDLARRYGEIVCAAHLGLVRGALEELGAAVETDLVPWVEPTMCLVEISPAPARG
jgi:predicted ArsR family transcriptional regulator